MASDYDSLIPVCRNAQSDSVKISALSNLALHWIEKNPDSNIHYAKEWKDISIWNEDTASAIRAIMHLSYSNYNKGLYDRAIAYAYEVFRYFENTKYQSYKVHFLILLGEIYRASSRFDAAIKHLKLAVLEVSETDSLNKAQSYNRLAAIYFEKKDYKNTKLYTDSSLLFANTSNFPHIVTNNYEVLGAMYRDTEKYELALNYLNKALQLLTRNKNLTGQPNVLNNIAITHFLKNDFQKASYYAKRSYELTKDTDLKALTVVSTEYLAKAYQKLGNYRQAYYYRDLQGDLFEELFHKEQDDKIARLNAEFESKLKEQQIEEQKNELKNKEVIVRNKQKLNRYYILGIAFLLITFVVLFVLLRRIWRSNTLLIEQNKQIESQSKELDKAYNDLKKLGDYKDTMINMLAHDLKNPLNLLMNVTYLSELDDKDEIIKHSATSMLNIVLNILDIYKYENTNLQLNKDKVPLMNIISSALEETHYLAKKNDIQLIREVEEDYFLEVDADIIRRVLVNLLTNAIKYSPRNSHVYIQAMQKSENVLTISVRDEGIGIEKEFQDKIFDKYVQLGVGKYEGSQSTGIGLTFCKMAIESHQGEIGVVSEKNQGASFWFSLPISHKIE